MTDINDNLEPIAEAPKKPLAKKVAKKAVKKAVKKVAKKPANKFQHSAPLKAGQKLQPGHSAPIAAPNLNLPPAIVAKWIGDKDKLAKAQAMANKIKELQAQIKKLKAAEEKAKEEKKKLAVQIDEQTLKYFHIIEKECSQFLLAAKAARSFLFRGVKKMAGSVFVGKPFDNRKPKDSSVSDQEKFDYYLTLAGFKALRSNSIFCTGSPNHADSYGKLVMVFPKNGFNFTWSGQHDDLILGDADIFYDEDSGNLEETVSAMEDLIDDYRGELDPNDFHPNKEKMAKAREQRKQFDALPSLKEFRKTLSKYWNRYDEETAAAAFKAFFQLEKAIGKKLQLLVSERKFAMDTITSASGVKNPAQAAKDKKKALDLVKSEEFKNTDMVSALHSQHEIYINGEYIAMDANKYYNMAKKYFMGELPKAKAKKNKWGGYNYDADDYFDGDDDDDDDY